MKNEYKKSVKDMCLLELHFTRLKFYRLRFMNGVIKYNH